MEAYEMKNSRVSLHLAGIDTEDVDNGLPSSIITLPNSKEVAM